MIKKIAFATVWVLDQDRAKDFYVNTLQSPRTCASAVPS
jgi:hypothetical protein